MTLRPAGADNFLKWRRTIDEHLELRNYVERLCRGLKRKRYVWYPAHRGARRRLVDVGIHKYPLAQGTYTDLSARFAAARPAEVSAEVRPDVERSAPKPTRSRAEVLAEVPAELAGKTVEISRGSPPGRPRQDREEK